MIYEGGAINGITLTPNEMATIRYAGYGFCVDIINRGPGDIYANWNGDAAVGDANSLLLEEKQYYEVRVKITDLNLISASPAFIQVVRVVR